MIDDFKRVESHDSDVHLRRPCGLPCRTGTGKAAIQHHTARFRLMPQLAKKLSVPTGPKKSLYLTGDHHADAPRT